MDCLSNPFEGMCKTLKTLESQQMQFLDLILKQSRKIDEMTKQLYENTTELYEAKEILIGVVDELEETKNVLRYNSVKLNKLSETLLPQDEK